MKRKICVVVASRANYGRIKAVLKAIQKHPKLELQLILGASALLERYGDLREIIKKDGFKVNATVYMILEGENPVTMAKSTGLGLLELPTVLTRLKPDITLTVADRFETISTAIASTYMNIPLAHTQGGEITGSIDESVRHAITKLAHVHLTTNENTAERLRKMGEDPKKIYVTGCPAIDLIEDADLTIQEDFIDKYKGVGAEIDFTKPYIVVLQHPVTTEYGKGFDQINQTLQAIYELKIPTVWFWPNVDAGSDDISHGIRKFREAHKITFMHFFKSMEPEDYLRLINNCKCIIGNSSSAIREGSYLGIPAVNLGTRQDGRERGPNIVDIGYDKEEIKNAIKKQVKHGRYPKSTIYGDGKAADKIADVLAKCELNLQKKITY